MEVWGKVDVTPGLLSVNVTGRHAYLRASWSRRSQAKRFEIVDRRASESKHC